MAASPSLPIVRSILLVPELSDLARGRDFVSRAAYEAGFAEQRVFDVIVASSEAMANAIEHAPVKGQIELKTAAYRDRLEVHVEGPGEFQAPRRLEERAHRGLGLPLMAKLADHLALYSGPSGGTLVSLTFYLPGVERAGEPFPPSIGDLLERNGLVAGLTRNSPVGIYILGSDFRYRWANKTYQSYLDEPFRSQDLTGVSLFEAVPGVLESGIAADVEQVSLTGEPVTREDYSIKGLARGTTWWTRSIVPLRGEGDGPPYDLLVVVSEQTERKLAEQALDASNADRRLLEAELKQREEQARHVIEHAPAPVYQIDFRGPRFVSVNDLMCSQTGYSRQELLKMSPFALLDKDSRRMFRQRIRQALAGEQPERSADYTCIAKDGHRFSVALDVAFRVEDGKALSAVVVGHDITERLLAEKERQEAAARLERVLGSIAGGYYELDLEWRFLRANAETERHFGLSERQLLGRSVWEVSGVGEGQETYEQFQKARTGGVPVHFEACSEYRPDAWAEMYVYPSPAGVEVYFRDISPRKLAEQALRDSEEKHRALAVENERLYRQQLDIAENLQLALLNIPSEIGPVKLGHLYRSATEAARVGGDFYDVFEVKDSIAILIGDVAGHGIQAARTATLVKDVVHAFAHQSLRTHEVLRRTNQLLIEKELPGFVTVFLGFLDRNTGHLRYSSAGHPETLVRRASGEIERLGCGFSPLGVYPEASWKANEIDLRTDDMLILYTDGVIEARRNGELFGEKRLERLVKRKRLSPQRLPHLILDQVLAFAGGNLEDDVAVLALSLGDIAGEAGPPGA